MWFNFLKYIPLHSSNKHHLSMQVVPRIRMLPHSTHDPFGLLQQLSANSEGTWANSLPDLSTSYNRRDGFAQHGKSFLISIPMSTRMWGSCPGRRKTTREGSSEAKSHRNNYAPEQTTPSARETNKGFDRLEQHQTRFFQKGTNDWVSRGCECACVCARYRMQRSLRRAISIIFIVLGGAGGVGGVPK